MTKTGKQKLNEKLAKWVGFTWYNEPCTFKDCRGHCGWRYPSGVAIYPLGMQGLPNFTDSLEACRKWLIPKLDKCSISTNKALGINVDCPNRFTIEVMMDKSYRSKGGSLVRNELWARIREDSPALALCLAIENLIDKEEK